MSIESSANKMAEIRPRPSEQGNIPRHNPDKRMTVNESKTPLQYKETGFNPDKRPDGKEISTPRGGDKAGIDFDRRADTKDSKMRVDSGKNTDMQISDKQGNESLADKVSEAANKAVEYINEHVKYCPIENGEWTGDRGESTWRPKGDYVPQKSNPVGKTWNQILKEYNIDGINFRNGEPDFSKISKGNVEIKNFSTERTDNFDMADIELAKKHGCSPEKVRQWRKEHNYTWHECKNQKTMQKVPSIIHGNIPHRGGISEAKRGE